MTIPKQAVEAADHTVSSMDQIFRAAKAQQDSRRGGAIGDVFALPVNAFSGPSAERPAQRLSAVREAIDLQLAAIVQAPVVARIRYETEDGEVHTLIVSPGVVNSPEIETRVASTRSPMGRLAEFPVGEERSLRLRDRNLSVTVIERLRVTARRVGSEWDGVPCWLENEDERLTLHSLRELLGAARPSRFNLDTDPLRELLSEAKQQAVFAQGFQRTVLKQMSLRAQPVLDHFQGEVFRMPIDRQLVLLGPAGTGKTTTLIRRIAQKLNEDDLFEEELDALWNGQANQRLATSNWAMFTPTELLQHYLKEAFAREGVAAPDHRVQTWAVKRRRLAREVLGILPTEGKSRFVLDERVSVLNAKNGAALAEIYGYFEQWCVEEVRARLLQAANELVATGQPEAVKSGKTILLALDRASDLAKLARVCARMDPPLELAEKSRNLIEARLHDELNGVIRREGVSFLDFLSEFLDDLEAERRKSDTPIDDDDDDDDELDSESEVADLSQANRQMRAIREYRRALRTLARARHGKRKLDPKSTASQLVDWLRDDRLPDSDVIDELSEAIAIQTAVGRIRSAARDLIRGCPAHYRRFRRAEQRRGALVLATAEEPIKMNRVEPNEVDMIMLFMLRASAEMFRHRKDWLLDQGIDHDMPDILVSIRENLLTQVYVDEVTDFTPVQLACIYALAHPQIASFFACGDLRQRLTSHGVADDSEFKWAVPGVELRSIARGYRQSRYLSELAADVASLDATMPATVADDREFDHEGKPPVLIEACPSEVQAEWLTARVREVARDVGRIPTVAVFVNGVARINPLREALEPLLGDHNIDVVACLDGRALGDDGSVRIFDVAHIKGLEFEAVFFLDIDQYAESQSTMLDKYLYVGVTRAATYLGISCQGALPVLLEPLRRHFVTTGWV